MPQDADLGSDSVAGRRCGCGRQTAVPNTDLAPSAAQDRLVRPGVRPSRAQDRLVRPSRAQDRLVRPSRAQDRPSRPGVRPSRAQDRLVSMWWVLVVLGWLVLLDCTVAVRVTPAAGGGGDGGGEGVCGQCDRRRCPIISPDSCLGHVQKDECDCCPVCLHGPYNASLETGLEASACDTVTCPRNEICVLNIQGIPICRCPSVFWCRRRERREICGRDGKTYKSRCYLRIAECGSNKKIRVAHKGSCESGGKKKRGKGRVRPRLEQQDETGPMQQQELSQQQQQLQQQQRQNRRQQQWQQQAKQQPQRHDNEGPANNARENRGNKNKQVGPRRQRNKKRKIKKQRERIKRRNRGSGCTSARCFLS